MPVGQEISMDRVTSMVTQYLKCIGASQLKSVPKAKSIDLRAASIPFPSSGAVGYCTANGYRLVKGLVQSIHFVASIFISDTHLESLDDMTCSVFHR